MGKYLATTAAFMYEEEVAYFAMIFLFGGLSLLIYHFLSKRTLISLKYTKINFMKSLLLFASALFVGSTSYGQITITDANLVDAFEVK